jgi:ribose 5-phosphate isomerase B
MRVGIATDHGGFGLKEELAAYLRETGHEVVDLGAHSLNPGDDYPDFVIPLAQAVAAGKVERGLAVCAAASAPRYVPTRLRASGPGWSRTIIRLTKEWSTTI